MRRIVSLLLTLCMCFSTILLFVACDEEEPEKSEKIKISVQFEPKTVTYNGSPQSIYVTGALPEDVTVTYEGNEQILPGSYTVKAIFSGDAEKYEIPEPMVACLTICAPEDALFVQASFESHAYGFDNIAKSIYVTGNIPEGVEVVYTGNNQTAPGVYTVTATFNGDVSKYVLPQPMKAKLIIVEGMGSGNELPLDEKDRVIVTPSFESKSYAYDGSPKYLEVEGLLPKDIQIIYTGNGKSTWGIYTVSVKIIADDTKYALSFTSANATMSIYNDRIVDDLSDDLNYLGANVFMLYWSDVENPEFDVDQITGDNVRDAIFDRNDNIEHRLNVKLEWDSTPGNVNNRARFVQKVQNVSSGGGGGNSEKYDLIATYSRTAGFLAIQGYLYNLKHISESHLSFSKAWWPPTLTETMTIGGGLYGITGEISTNVLHQMNVIYFNKDEFAAAYNAEAKALGFQGNSSVSPACEMIYEYAYEKSEKHPYGDRWTTQKLIDYTANRYKDLDGNNTLADGSVGRYDTDDYFGFCTSDEYVDAFYTAANMRFVEQAKDDGRLIICPEYGSAKTVRLVNQLGTWLNTASCIVQRNGDATNFSKPFKDGNALFIATRAHYAEHNLLDAGFEYGILPVPKYNTEQMNYYTSLGNAHSVYGIYKYFDPKTDFDLDKNGTLTMLTAVLECWASESYRLITPEIFTENMCFKYGEVQYETHMYDYIRASIILDLGRVFTNDLSFMSKLPAVTACDNLSWSSVYGMYRDSLEEKLNRINNAFLEGR